MEKALKTQEQTCVFYAHRLIKALYYFFKLRFAVHLGQRQS